MHTACIDKWTSLTGGAKDWACPLKCMNHAGLAEGEAALLSQASESGSQNIESGFAEPQPVDLDQQQGEVVVNDDEETQAIF